ncbi:hypothetical protein Tcan_00929, partial [Toxocara canis]
MCFLDCPGNDCAFYVWLCDAFWEILLSVRRFVWGQQEANMNAEVILKGKCHCHNRLCASLIFICFDKFALCKAATMSLLFRMRMCISGLSARPVVSTSGATGIRVMKFCIDNPYLRVIFYIQFLNSQST